MSKEKKALDKRVTRDIHRLFWRANWQDPKNLILSYVLRMTAIILYNVFIPLVSAFAIQAILDKDLHAVNMYALGVLALAIGYCICWGFGDVAINRNGIRASMYVQEQAFANLIRKDYAFYGNAYFGSLGAQAFRLRDAFHRYGFLVTLSIPKQTVIVVAGISVIAWQSVSLAATTLITMAFVLSFTLLTSQWRLKFRRRVAETSSTVAGDVGDALTHGSTVKSFATETFEERRMQNSLSTWGRAQYRAWSSAWPADVGRMTLAAIATAILLVFSARAYIDGAISIVVVILIQLYVIKLVASTLDIAEILKQYEEAMGMAYEPVKTMQIPATVIDPAAPKKLSLSGHHVLALENVEYRYPEVRETQHAVDGLSLEISPGEKVGIVGYSGSGKTTITKLLMRFMDVTGGSIRVGEHDIRNYRQADLRDKISYVPQEPILFHRSIRENIIYGNPAASESMIQTATKAAYVDEFAKELPEGLETLVGERGVKLSGGQRQRVAIARALLKDAPILVLDEATSALDSRSEQLVQKALWKLMKDRTALVIAHRLSTIQRMDRIAVMDKGKIVQLGTHAELLKDKKGIYAELWSHQSGGYVGLPSEPDETDGIPK